VLWLAPMVACGTRAFAAAAPSPSPRLCNRQASVAISLGPPLLEVSSVPLLDLCRCQLDWPPVGHAGVVAGGESDIPCKRACQILVHETVHVVYFF
jgi:hypothetical protein